MANCKRCNKEFTRSSNSQTFCTRECRFAGRAENMARRRWNIHGDCQLCLERGPVALIRSTHVCFRCLTEVHLRMLAEQKLYPVDLSR